MAKAADQLSRKSSTTSKTLRIIKNSEKFEPKGALYNWLKKPVLDWTLPEKIVYDISKIMQK
jgi:hypothetical protein